MRFWRDWWQSIYKIFRDGTTINHVKSRYFCCYLKHQMRDWEGGDCCQGYNPDSDFKLLSAYFLTGKIDCQYDCKLERTVPDFNIYQLRIGHDAIFMDIGQTESGEGFIEAILQKLETAQVAVVPIGSADWMTPMLPSSGAWIIQMIKVGAVRGTRSVASAGLILEICRMDKCNVIHRLSCYLCALPC